MSKVIIVGGGTMGASIARLFASKNWSVQLIEPNADHGAKLRENLRGVAILPDLKEACDADVAVECVPEEAALKRRVLRQIEDKVARDAPVLSNTSGLSLSDISSEMSAPIRAAIAHFFNPGDVIPAVEVVTAPEATEDFTETVMSLLRSLGKRPARLSREVPGFIANRIQHAIMRECFHLVETGVAEPADIDEIVRWSIGVRMAASGPFRQRDLNGLDTHLKISRYLYPDLASGTSPSPVLVRLVEEGRLGRRSGHGFYDWPDGQGEKADENALRAVLAAVEAYAGESET
ncbi:3-hydroxyacyl-CoA dehydrogenase NAD-binding domain-containing protein [Roseibacterium beibuensis]|uniref:3-hydroxyacyl-CoA dehydrogenase family protein n=1 Tax=[Roseibacterium] beibuensis TaxID=1193142 RepID=A0ABP9LJN7_9RHOB|nr:3-hydroxyacyl-CoA dehydrogenase NAD-binding domain-containing protein [Roseibacterium beibuensis]MCS6623519.1 3-hydroxyacyl-CoA dehydrogenase NAD-binding domain-containing protein [Roseibacterium beibuensis]